MTANRIVRSARATLLVAALIVASFAHAQASDPAPRPPCDAASPIPQFGTGAATLEVWANVDWQPPACIGWSDNHYRLVIALAGRIDASSDEVLKRRIGAISGMRGLQYWSVTENASRVLIRDASALASPEGPRRDDFAPGEIRPGAELYFVEEDNRSSHAVTYRMRVREASADRIVVETENTTPVEAMLMKLYPPGALRAAYILSKLDAASWGLYVVSASTPAASPMVRLAKDSYVNRARALYGHFAGEGGR